MFGPRMLRVLFVSKPIAPPFHDGSKCLVRDIATSLSRYHPVVFSTAGAPSLRGVQSEPVYGQKGSFSPSLADNARAFARLALGARGDIWNFVFAPNAASSTVAAVLQRLRRVPTVQTIASAPRQYQGAARLLFGDRIVALSAFTRDRFLAAGVNASRLHVIPPPVRVEPASSAEVVALRAKLDIPPDAPVVTYPGDVEMSIGAPLVASSIPLVVERLREVIFVFACRKKTARADRAERELRARLSGFERNTRFVGELPSLLPLLQGSKLVLFPVDDLYGKVDLPIALLEAMALGVPVVALDRGPLRELDGAALVSPLADAVASLVVDLLQDEARLAELSARARQAVAKRHDPKPIAEAYESLYDELVGRA